MGLIYSILIMAVMLFLTVFFGGGEPWTQLLAYGFVYAAAIALLFKRHRIYLPRAGKTVAAVLMLLFALALIQALNPRTLLDAKTFFPFTFSALFTMQAAERILFGFALFYIVTNAIESAKYAKLLLTMIVICAFYALAAALMYKDWQYSFLLTGFKTYSFGPFISRNHGAAFMIMGFFSAAALFLPSFLNAENRVSPQEGYKKAFFAFILCLLGFGVFATRSRGGMAAFAAGIFALIWLLTMALSEKKKTKIIVSCSLAAAGLILLAAGFYNIDLINQFAQRSEGFSFSVRKALYSSGFNMLKDFPLTGVGYDAFSVALAPYFPQEIKRFALRLHSDWFELLLSIGIPAFTALAAAAVYTAALLLKRIKYLNTNKKIMFCSLLAGLTAFCIANMVDFHFHLMLTYTAFFVFLGILCCESFWHEQVRPFKIPLYIKPIFILAAGLCLYFSYVETSAWRQYVTARIHRNKEKLTYYKSATQIYPIPRYAGILATETYNMSLNKNISEEEASNYRAQAAELTEKYLKKYPLEKQLSKIYILTH